MSDLIEREEAIKAIKAEARCAGGAVAEEYADMFIYAILRVKGVDAERKGEWIEHRPPTNDYCGMVECPFCGEELVGEPTDFNYCPNCGAKMEVAWDEN